MTEITQMNRSCLKHLLSSSVYLSSSFQHPPSCSTPTSFPCQYPAAPYSSFFTLFPPAFVEELRENECIPVFFFFFFFLAHGDQQSHRIINAFFSLSLIQKENFKHYSLRTSSPITLSWLCTLPLMGHGGSHNAF